MPLTVYEEGDRGRGRKEVAPLNRREKGPLSIGFETLSGRFVPLLEQASGTSRRGKQRSRREARWRWEGDYVR